MKKTKLDMAKEKNECARLELSTALASRKLKILNKYDATEPSVKRRQPVQERKGEDDVYKMRDRLNGCAIGRDLERNYSPARGILNQFRMNVVGALGKLQVNCDGGDSAAAWFNGVWAKDCDLRDDNHFSTVLQNVVASVLREGDVLAVVDDGLVEDSGKLLFWESDQIVPLDEPTLAETQFKQAVQENGIIRDKFGRMLAYVATGKRGLQSISDIKDATIFKRGDARLIRNPWRLNQGRGVPSILTSATNFTDLYEILSKELQTAKRAAGQYGWVKRKNAVVDWDNPARSLEYLSENSGKEAATVTAESAGGGESTAKNYERLESFTGGFTDYIDADDDVQLADITRPNVHLNEFIEAVLGHAGASMGLARAYSLLRADSSYTAFRGDMILTWSGAFYPMQKWLERYCADWIAVKVLAWAMRTGRVKEKLPSGWEQTLSWRWPTMPHVDEQREEAAVQNALKNGTTDYSKLLGPDWLVQFKALAKQIEEAKRLGIPLSIFETKSGGLAGSDQSTDKTRGENNE